TSTLSFYCLLNPPTLHSFPTRRSSDLDELVRGCPIEVTRETQRVAKCFVTMLEGGVARFAEHVCELADPLDVPAHRADAERKRRSEEHTSELQSPYDLVCRLLLEKKNI